MDLINRYTNDVIFSAEVETVNELVVAAISAKADLREANLRGADLRGAKLFAADLYGANLFGAKAEINGHSVLQINGLAYPILITDTHLRAGCQNHTFAEWRAMTKEQIDGMDGKRAIKFYPVLISIIDALCKDRESGV